VMGMPAKYFFERRGRESCAEDAEISFVFSAHSAKFLRPLRSKN
jgi:hypothetical protein